MWCNTTTIYTIVDEYGVSYNEYNTEAEALEAIAKCFPAGANVHVEKWELYR